jgi:hypothetical protein
MFLFPFSFIVIISFIPFGVWVDQTYAATLFVQSIHLLP